MVLNGKKNKRVICTVDGPLSILRLTDRYGLAMAKLIPLIIFTENWSIDAVILRKSISGIKKAIDFSSQTKIRISHYLTHQVFILSQSQTQNLTYHLTNMVWIALIAMLRKNLWINFSSSLQDGNLLGSRIL